MLGQATCTRPPGDSLRFGLASAPITLDPRFATDAASERINRLLYRRLVVFDEDSLPVPALATWRQITPKRYEFTLGKEGRIFHDGTRLTSVDVKATYDFILDSRNASPHLDRLATIERVEAPDTDTIHFYLNRPDPLFPGHLSIGIVPANRMASGHDFNRSPIGSGPFSFLDWPNEGRLRLARLADGRTFEFLHVPDPTVRVLKLLRGEIDMLQNDLPPELVAYLLSLAGLLVAVGIAFPLGIFAAVRKDTLWDHLAIGISLFGVSIPVFWMGPVLILILSLWLGWFPVSGREELASLVLPALTLGIALSAILSGSWGPAACSFLG